MKVSTLRRISKFINNLITSGYDGNTDITTLLADMEFTTLPDNLINILTYISEYEQLAPPIKITDQYPDIYTMITTTDIEKLIMISDELCIDQLTNLIIHINHPLRRIMDNYIINCNGLYAIQTYNTGYKVLPDPIYTYKHDDSTMPIRNCIKNGLYLKNIYYNKHRKNFIDTLSITDVEKINTDFWYFYPYPDKKEMLWLNSKTIKNAKFDLSTHQCNLVIRNIVSFFPSLETIEIVVMPGGYDHGYDIPNDKPSTMSRRIKSLKILHCALNGIIHESFKNIKELDISHCKAGPKDIIPCTVKKLRIEDTNIDDAMISACTNIKYLNISGNSDITTCAPFAKTLKHLRLTRTAAIKDTMIALCTNLKILDVSYNPNITTCALNVAGSLTKLYADGENCGICDDTLKLCSKLVILKANNNRRITTCDSFAKSLIQLYAGDLCGIGDDGIKSCLKLKTLCANNNRKIMTCVPFAKSLEILDASGRCGIRDNGLILCSKLKYLNASHNSNITTCAPFAKTLLHLVAYNDRYFNGYNNCGIDDDGIKLCTRLIKLEKFNDNRITLKLPIIYDE